MVRFKNDYFRHSGKKTTFQITMQNSAEGHNNSFKNRKIIMTFREEQQRVSCFKWASCAGNESLHFEDVNEFWISREG